MFSYIKRISGVVTVEQTDTSIIVQGVPSAFMLKDIHNAWKTSRIGVNLFTNTTGSSFEIPKFFALDLLYALEAMMKSTQRLGMSRRTSTKIIEGLYEHTWLGGLKDDFTPRLDLSKVRLFHKTPLPFQMDFLHRYSEFVPRLNLNGFMLAGAAGSGKTFTSMCLAECAGVDHVIVVCPKNAVLRVWKDSVQSEYINPPSAWVALEGLEYRDEKYIIGHYETIPKLLELSKRLRGTVAIILDESHNLNETVSLRTQLFVELCKQTKSQNIIWASGTPIKSLGSESIPLFRTIDPLFTEDVEARFKKIYGKDASKALDILSNRISSVSHKIEKKELKLIDPIIENVAVKVPNGDDFTLEAIKKDMVAFIEERNNYYLGRKVQDYGFYDSCLDYFDRNLRTKDRLVLMKYKLCVKTVQTTSLRDCKEEVLFCNKYENSVIMPALPAEWRKEFKNVKSVVKYVALKIQGECLGRVLGKKRMECILAMSNHIDYAKYIESTAKKTLIFTSYVEALENCQNVLKQQNYNPLVVYGKTNSELASIINVFEKDPGVNPLVATFNSLSTAVPLIMADVLVMLNAPFRDYIHQQAISRIHRLGADTQCYVYIGYLDTGDKPNLSTRSLDILKWSQTQVEAIMGIKSPFEIEELAVSTENYFDCSVGNLDIGLEEHFIAPTVVSAKRPSFAQW